MKKTLYIIVLTLCFVLALIGKSYGRDIKIDWQKCYGGTFNEYGNSIIQTFDDGYIFTGSSISKDGDIGGNQSNPNFYDFNAWIVKLDKFGNIQWKKILDRNQSYDYGELIIQTKDSNYIVAGCSSDDIGAVFFDAFLTKLDKNGNVLWSKNFNYNHAYEIRSIFLNEDDDGNICFANKEEYDRFSNLYKLDKNGNIIWHRRYDVNDKSNIVSVISSENKSYTLLLNKTVTINNLDSNVINILKIDSVGNNISDITLKKPANFICNSFLITNNNEFVVIANTYIANSLSTNMFVVDSIGNVKLEKKILYLSSNYLDGTPINIISLKNKKEIVLCYTSFSYYTLSDDIIITKIDLLGNIIGQDSIGSTGTEYANNIFECKDGSLALIATSGKADRDVTCNKGRDDIWIAKIFFNPNYITGDIFTDINNNCIQNINDKGLPNYTLKASNNLYNSYSTSQQNGKYLLTVADTGLYNIELLPNPIYPYFSPSNCNSYSIHLRDSIDTANFALKPQFLCPFNTVNVSSSPPFRIGQAKTYYVNYCNNGTILSPNTYITIKLDSLLDFNSSTIPYTTLPNHTYRFNIGNLDFLTCGNFSFVATPRIGAVQLNQTLCTEAHIYPDTVCTTPNYTGSYIVASAQCLGDSIELKLENRGGDMQVRKRYIVIEDQVMRINQEYQLPRNGTLIEKMPADSGHTYRIIAEQEDNFPASYGDKFATAAIEACRPNPSLNFSIGYFTQFPNYDANLSEP